MKQVTPALLSLINAVIEGTPYTAGFSSGFSSGFSAAPVGPAVMFDFDLYTILPKASVVADFNNDFNTDFADFAAAGLSFTTADFDIAWNGVTFKSGGVRVDEKSSKVQAHWKVGIDSDTWTVVLMPRPVDLVTGQEFPDTIGGVPFINAVQAGLLDAADIQVDRAVFAFMPQWGLTIGPTGAVPLGVIPGIFAGVVGEVDTTGAAVTLVVNDYRSLFSLQMPRHYFQGECRHTLFDVGCTLQSGAFSQNGTAVGGSSPTSIAQNLGTPALPGGAGTWVLGSITFNSGYNNGLTRMITGWGGPGQPFTLLDGFPNPVNAGDAFTVTPGCNKTQPSCNAFGNILNFGGFPYVPVPETAG
jgi:hypothetical protein